MWKFGLKHVLNEMEQNAKQKHNVQRPIYYAASEKSHSNECLFTVWNKYMFSKRT